MVQAAEGAGDLLSLTRHYSRWGAEKQSRTDQIPRRWRFSRWQDREDG
jgi:hypothetical protein